MSARRARRVEEFSRGRAQRGGRDRIRTQRVVMLREGLVQMLCGREAVHECGLPASFCGGLEAVEELEAGRVGEVGVVCVWREVVVCVCCVDGVHLGREVPEAAVMGRADVCDTFDEGLCRPGIWWCAGDEAESLGVDCLEEGFQAGLGGCGRYAVVGDGWEGWRCGTNV